MPRLSKKEKQYWSFFINPDTGRRTYHELCRRCCRDCKQSFRMISIYCPVYMSKRSKDGKKISETKSKAVSDMTGESSDQMQNEPFRVHKSAKSAPFNNTKPNVTEQNEMQTYVINGMQTTISN